MRYPVDDFLPKWNVTAGYGFGQKTDYGSHEAADLNINTGSDTDLGQPLYAIADGEITSVHSHIAIPSFGKHIHLKIDGPWGTRYVHYAHCNEVFVTEGQKVKEGDKIATVGKTGLVSGGGAHCHFAIKKQATGIDAIAKTLDDLKKWEDPIAFIKHWINEQAPDVFTDLDNCRLARDAHWVDLQRVKDVLGIPGEYSITNLLGRIDSLLASERELGKKEKIISEMNEEIVELQRTNGDFKKEIEETKELLIIATEKINELDRANKEQAEEITKLKNSQVQTESSIKKLIEFLFNLFARR